MSEEPKENKDVHTELIFITSERARHWLKINIANNRPIVNSRIQQYMRDMKNGKWQKNGETIKFAETGELIDGQHRLQACVEGGIGFWSLVAYGVKKEAFITIDRGQSRTIGQMLHLTTGITDYNAITATVAWLYRFREGIMLGNTSRPTTSETEELLRLNPGIPDAVAAARRIVHQFKAGPVPVIGICHYLFTRQNATLAEVYFDALAKGASLREIDPVYQLRSRVITSSSSTSKKLSSYELLALMFKTWLAEREQRTMTVLRWTQAESFPNIGPIESVQKIRPEKVSAQAGVRRGRKGIPQDEKKAMVAASIPSPPQPKTKLDALLEKHQGLDKRH